MAAGTKTRRVLRVRGDGRSMRCTIGWLRIRELPDTALTDVVGVGIVERVDNSWMLLPSATVFHHFTVYFFYKLMTA